MEHVGRVSEGGAVDDAARLALRLDTLSTSLFWLAGSVAVLCVIAGLAGVLKALVHRREL